LRSSLAFRSLVEMVFSILTSFRQHGFFDA
jgi:hypothetical protein